MYVDRGKYAVRLRSLVGVDVLAKEWGWQGTICCDAMRCDLRRRSRCSGTNIVPGCIASFHSSEQHMKLHNDKSNTRKMK